MKKFIIYSARTNLRVPRKVLCLFFLKPAAFCTQHGDRALLVEAKKNKVLFVFNMRHGDRCNKKKSVNFFNFKPAPYILSLTSENMATVNIHRRAKQATAYKSCLQN